MKATASALSAFILLAGVSAAMAADLEPRLYSKAPIATDASWRGFYVAGNREHPPAVALPPLRVKRRLARGEGLVPELVAP